MSNSDSFIQEVTEEVRRDRLMLLFRRYGWIGAVLVAGIVGGTAYNEWQSGQEVARAQAFGAALETALERDDADQRFAALGAIRVDSVQQGVLTLLQAQQMALTGADGAAQQAADAFAALARNTSQPEIYRDLAVLRQVLALEQVAPIAERRALLETIVAPGRALRVLAREQLGYLLLEEGRPADARLAFLALLQDQEAPPGLRVRLRDILTTFGPLEGDDLDVSGAGAAN